jgi:hypothetical protein
MKIAVGRLRKHRLLVGVLVAATCLIRARSPYAGWIYLNMESRLGLVFLSNMVCHLEPPFVAATTYVEPATIQKSDMVITKARSNTHNHANSGAGNGYKPK